MKFLGLLFAILAVAQAVVLNSESVQAFRRAAEQSKAITTTLDDGSVKVEIFTSGVYEGYVLESGVGEVQIFGADGVEITSDPSASVEKRAAQASILTKFWKVIRKFGSRVVTFLTCAGVNVAIHCADDIIQCAVEGSIAPWDCLEGLACMGTAAYKCR